MKGKYILGRVLHILLVVLLTYTLLRLLYWSFSQLADDARQGNFAPHPVNDAENMEPQKPSPQKIVRPPSFRRQMGKLTPIGGVLEHALAVLRPGPLSQCMRGVQGRLSAERLLVCGGCQGLGLRDVKHLDEEMRYRYGTSTRGK